MGLVELFKAIGVLGELVKAFAQVIAFFKMKYGEKWAEEMIAMATTLTEGFQLVNKPDATTEELQDAVHKINAGFKYMRRD